MKKIILVSTLLLGSMFYSQVGIGISTPDNSAMLDVVSLTKGVLVPRMTTAQRDAIASPANALTIFNTSEQCYNYYNMPTTVWKSLCAGGTTTNPTITALTCGSASQTGIVTASQAVSGATLTIPYTGGNGASYPAGTPITASGGTVTGLTLTLQAGNLASGAGSLVYTISGTPSGVGSAVFSIAFGGQACSTATVTSAPAASITSLTCTATQSGTLTVGTAASGVTFTVPYTGGNGIAYSAGTGVASTGVTGLTATLVAGTLANGAGTLTYNVTGTPSGSGNAYFSLSFGGANCSVAFVQVSNSSGSSSSSSLVSKFDVSTYSSFAICSDGSLLTQGSNYWGQMGTGSRSTSTVAGQTSAFTTLNFNSTNPAVAIATQGQATWVLDNNGKVWGMGAQTIGGAVGTGGPDGEYLATPTTLGLSNVKSIFAGGLIGGAIKSDGTVWTWGIGPNGQLGNGTQGNSRVPVQVKGVGGVGFLNNISQVSIGPGNQYYVHSCAVSNSGNAYCWGVGNLGDPNIPNFSSTPVQVKGVNGNGYLSNVKAIAATQFASCAVLNDGTVYAWGTNSNGLLGQNTTTGESLAPIQVKGVGGVGFLTDVADVKPLQEGFLVLKNDGTVYGWGVGTHGEFGNGTLTSSNAPIQVGGGVLTGIKAIKTGVDGQAALSSNGTLYGWGDNYYNAFAPNVTAGTYQTTPVVLSNYCTVQ